MKLKSLILAFPVLCLACNTASSPADPASNMDASPMEARRVAGVYALTSDLNYDEPCNILGEEYVRTTFNIGEATELEEGHQKNGCEFGWAGHKVLVTFGGSKPYASVYHAEAAFDKLYQGKSEKAIGPVTETPPPTTQQTTEGNNPSAIVNNHDNAEQHTTDDNQPKHGGITAATPPLTEPAVSQGNFEAVPNVGDKAVWDANTGAMHVLYNNHIINVTVETKDKPEIRKEHAQSLVEVLIDKISSNEYTRQM